MKYCPVCQQSYSDESLNYAKIYLGLGETEKVFDWLEKGFAERAVRLPWLLADPQFDSLRTDERFVKLSKKIRSLFRKQK